MSLAEINPDFRDLLLAFADGGVEFVIVGAYALAMHGVPRTTGDIDVFVRASRENAVRVVAALDAFGAPLSVSGISAKDFEQLGMVYQIGLPPRRIDVLTSLSGISFDEALVDKREELLDGRGIPFIGRDAFIKNKLATGRPQDLADVDRLKKA